jgi:hypothetical protein
MLRHSLRLPVICALVLAAPVLAANTRAQAQDNAGAQAPADSMQAPPSDDPQPIPADDGSMGTGDPSLADEQALQSEGENRPEAQRDATDPFEDPHEGYYFVGLMYRHIVVPKFMQNLFVDGGTTVSNPGFGAQFEYRKDGFSIIGNVWWQDFSFVGPFREAGDPATNTEIIDSSWSAVFASASFMWSTAFNDVFAFEYGIDVGLGVVLGDGVRTEAFSTDGDQTFSPCAGALNPITSASYCGAPTSGGATDPDGEDGEHYNVVARKWSDGGSVPNVVPWLGIPHIALRIKPIHQVQIRLDAGFFGGFWFGAGLSYGI